MITRKLNPRVYDSLPVLLDAVRLYRVYRWLDTLPLYLYYELLIILNELEFDRHLIDYMSTGMMSIKISNVLM